MPRLHRGTTKVLHNTSTDKNSNDRGEKKKILNGRRTRRSKSLSANAFKVKLAPVLKKKQAAKTFYGGSNRKGEGSEERKGGGSFDRSIRDKIKQEDNLKKQRRRQEDQKDRKDEKLQYARQEKQCHEEQKRHCEEQEKEHKRLHSHVRILPTIIRVILEIMQKHQSASSEVSEESGDSDELQGSEGSGKKLLTVFHALDIPLISQEAYIQRLVQFSHCPPAGLLIALHYIRKITSNQYVALVPETFHRLLLTSIVLASKWTTDFFLDNHYYAEVGGVPTKELNLLEMEMLKMMGWKVFVAEREYEEVEEWVVGMLCKEGDGKVREIMKGIGYGDLVQGGNVEKDEGQGQEEKVEKATEEEKLNRWRENNDREDEKDEDRVAEKDGRRTVGMKEDSLELFSSPCSSVEFSPKPSTPSLKMSE